MQLFNSSVNGTNTINGTFTANMAGSSGGAIFNQGNINSISGEFTSNHTTNSWATGKVVGGAIANKGGTINSIDADFNSNYSDQYGGAIANFVENSASSEITSVAGNFNNNYIVVNNSEAFGGAVYNNGEISTMAYTNIVPVGVLNASESVSVKTLVPIGAQPQLKLTIMDSKKNLHTVNR